MSNEKKINKITLKKKESLMDISTLTLPFAAEYKKTKKIKDENGNEKIVSNIIEKLEVRHNDGSIITVTSNADYGVPTLYEQQVMAALSRILIKEKLYTENSRNIVEFNKILDEVLDNEKIVGYIDVKEIAKEMGYKKNPSVNIQKKICDSIKCLYYAAYETSLDRIYIEEDDSYLMEAEKGIHLINEYEVIKFTELEKEKKANKSRGRKAKTKEAELEYKAKKDGIFKGKIKITINAMIYKSLAYDQYLIYDVNKTLKLEKFIDRSIYSLTLKWAGKKKKVIVNDETFFNYIYIDERLSIYKRKAKITDAIKRLSQSGLCIITELSPGVREYNFSIKKIEPELINIKTEPHSNLTDKFLSPIELISGFEALGIDKNFIMNKVLTSTLEEQKRLRALCRQATLIKKYNPSNNVTNLILARFEDNTKIDEKFYDDL